MKWSLYMPARGGDEFAMAIPPPQIVYSYSTAADILPSVPNFGSWNNAPILHSTQYYDPALGGASIGYSSPAMGSGYSFPSTSQKVYSNGRSSKSDISSQHFVANHTPFVFDPIMPTDFSPYNILPHQRQIHTVPQPGPLSFPVTPMIPPPLAAESPQFIYPPNQPPVYQPYSFPLHSNSSSSLLSCRWLNDDAVTHCGFTGTLEALKSHCKTIHFTGPKIVRIECHWEGCDYYKRSDPTVRVMLRDSIWRHTREVHLRLKRGCI